MNPLLDTDPEDYDPLDAQAEQAGDSSPKAKMNPLVEEVSRVERPQQPVIEVKPPDARAATATLTTELSQPGPRAQASAAQVLPATKPEVVMPAPQTQAADTRVDSLMQDRVGASFKPLVTRRGALREGPGVT